MSTNEAVLARAAEILEAERYDPKVEADADYGYQYKEHIDGMLAKKLAADFPDMSSNALLRAGIAAKRAMREPKPATSKSVTLAIKVTVPSQEVAAALQKRSAEWCGEALAAALAS